MEELNVTTARGAAAMLGISLHAVDLLRQAGLLPDPSPVGRQLLYPKSAVEALAARPVLAPPHQPAYVVRVTAKTEVADDPERRWLGYSAQAYGPDLSPEENEQARADALRGWWPVKQPEQYVHMPLIAVLAGFIVQTYEIAPGGTARAGRFRFEVKPLDEQRALPWAETRLKLERGPLSLPIGTAWSANGLSDGETSVA